MSQKFLTNIDMQQNQITNLPDVQTADDQATSKKHVDTAISTAISNLVDSAPGVLDTLNEIAAAINDDASFATTITNQISGISTDLAATDNIAKGAALVGVYDPDNKITATNVNAALLELKDAIGSGATDISALITEISDARGGEANLDARLDGIDSDVSGLDSRLTTAEGDIDSLEGRVTTAEGDIDSLEGRMTTAEGDIDSLEGRMTTAEGDIDSLEGRVTTAEGDIDVLEGRATTTEGDVASLEGRMTTAEGDIDSLEGRVTTAEGDIDSLEGRVTTAEGDIDSLEGRVTTAEGNISSLQTDKTDKHSANIGNGTATSFTINHSLNSQDVVVMVREVSSPYAAVITDVEITSTTSVTVKFATAPSSNQYRVVIIG